MKVVLYLGIVIGIIGVLLLGYGTKLVQDGEDSMASASEHRDPASGRFSSGDYESDYEAGEREVDNGMIVQSFTQPILILALVVELDGIGLSTRDSNG